MKIPIYAVIVMNVIGFAWPLVTRYSELKSPFTIVLLFSIATVFFLITALGFMPVEWSAITPRELKICALAGLLNTVGLIAYSHIFSHQERAAQYIPIVMICLFATLTIGGILLHSDPFLWKRAVGWVLAAAAIWFLTAN